MLAQGSEPTCILTLSSPALESPSLIPGHLRESQSLPELNFSLKPSPHPPQLPTGLGTATHSASELPLSLSWELTLAGWWVSLGGQL